MSPSWRRWGSVTGLPCPFRSDSARNRIEVSGDRRSCAISTTSSSPSGPARLDAKSSDSAVDPESCQRRSTAVAVICRFPLASCFLRHAAGGHQDRKSTRLNSSHLVISYAVFCLKKKKKKQNTRNQIRRLQDDDFI